MFCILVNIIFVALHMSCNSVGAASMSNDNGDTRIQPDMPASCAHQQESFCFDKGDEYPQSIVDKVIDRLPMMALNDKTSPDLAYREGFDNPDCPANSSFVNMPIYYIIDENDDVRVVLQSEEKFKQIYSTKWCLRPGLITYDTPHFLKSSRTLEMFKIECVNTFMNFDFLVLTDEGNVELARPKGGLPVCCKCRYSNPNAD